MAGMNTRRLLFLDAAINLLLGALLILVVLYPTQITGFLGVPEIVGGFYSSIFGAVLVGIAIALIIEARRDPSSSFVGLGLGGAISINLSGGILLVVWLVCGDLQLPHRGFVFLSLLALLLIVISAAELFAHFRQREVK